GLVGLRLATYAKFLNDKHRRADIETLMPVAAKLESELIESGMEHVTMLKAEEMISLSEFFEIAGKIGRAKQVLKMASSIYDKILLDKEIITPFVHSGTMMAIERERKMAERLHCEPVLQAAKRHLIIESKNDSWKDEY